MRRLQGSKGPRLVRGDHQRSRRMRKGLDTRPRTCHVGRRQEEDMPDPEGFDGFFLFRWRGQVGSRKPNVSRMRPSRAFCTLSSSPLPGDNYMQKYQALLNKAVGAELVWSGQAIQMPIGPSEKTWDMVALVRYPSARAYLTMRATEEYQEARVHRRAALYDSRLIMTSQNYPNTI